MQGKKQADTAACPSGERLTEWLRGELTDEDARRIEAHLSDCPACREHAASFKEIVDHLAAVQAPRARRDLAPAVMARLSDAERHDADRIIRFPVLARVAAGLLVLATAGLAWRLLGPARPRNASMSGPHAQVVEDALHWLACTQEPSGAWDPAKWEGRTEYEIALTGMALLALTRHGAASDGENPHTDAIQRAVAYLLKQQRENGCVGPEQDGMMYNHGIATVALLEAHATSRDERLTPALARAIRFIRERQLAAGGWGYSVRSSEQPNTAISVWQLRALTLARSHSVGDTTGVFNKGLLWLSSMVDPSGRLGYRDPKDFPEGPDTLTAMGALCLFSAASQISGIEEVEARIRKAFLGAADESADVDFYRWFFIASALRAGGDDASGERLARLQASLVARLRRDSEHPGTWDPVGRWSTVGGRLYTTTMAALSLEPSAGS